MSGLGPVARLGLGTAALGRPEYLNLQQGPATELGEGRYDRERLRGHAHGVHGVRGGHGCAHRHIQHALAVAQPQRHGEAAGQCAGFRTKNGRWRKLVNALLLFFQ